MEALFDAIEDLCRYHQQKTLFECSLAIRKAKQELSKIQYQGDAILQREYTVELQRCRRKLVALRERFNAKRPEYGELFEDLFKCMEERIAFLANKRKPQRPR